MTPCRQHRDRASRLAKPTRMPDGRWRVEGTAARLHGPGDPLVYAGGRRELRDRAGLDAIIRLLAGKPVTVGHAEHGGVKIGTVESARLSDDETHAVATMILDRAVPTDANELSIGYTATLDKRGYQLIESVVELAIVERGRCGRSCAVQLDHCLECAESEATARLRDRMAGRAEMSPTTNHDTTPLPPNVIASEWRATQALRARGGR